MAFFDTTPIGRIINRFSRDIDEVDLSIPPLIKSGFLKKYRKGSPEPIELGVVLKLVASMSLRPYRPSYSYSDRFETDLWVRALMQ